MGEKTLRHILVIRLTAMGDVAIAAPVVASVCEANPDVQIDVLSTPFFEPFFEEFPNFRFIGTDIRKEKSGVRGLWKLFRSLIVNEYTDVLDIHNVLRSKVLSALFYIGGVRVRFIDKGRREKNRLVNGDLRAQLKPTVERYADVFRDAGLVVPSKYRIRSAWSMPEAFRGLKEETASDGSKSEKSERWIGVSPFAQHKGKMYPAEKMREVIDGLLAEDDVRVFIFGGGGSEKKKADDFAQGRERVHNVIGVMSLREEMALMSNLDVMLSMDSSAMHISSLFGVRVVSVWGATHPCAGFLGYGQSEADAVQRDDLECRPCSIYGIKECKFRDYRCFDISPEIIVRRVLSK